jgi:nitrogenase molybdenum-iron protein alpha/beta subunit
MAALQAGGFDFKDYEGMMPEMKKNTLVIDDISHHEMERLIEIYKPDIIALGIKDKFVIEKMGMPCKQLHSYDYGGPYAAFRGAINFYREVDRMVNTKNLEVHHAAVGKGSAVRRAAVHASRQWREERNQSLAQKAARRRTRPMSSS